MRVHHYFPVTKNSGDFFVRDGIRKLVRTRRADAEFVDLAANAARGFSPQYGLRPPLLEYSNDEADLVIVGGSNLYEGPSYGWDWGLATDADSIRALRVPLALVGIGTGSRLGERVRSLSRRAHTEIRALHERARAAGVRDVATHALVTALGASEATLTGCPALYLGERPLGPPRSDRVVVSFPPIRFQKNRDIWASLLAGIDDTIRTASRSGLEVSILCHDDRDVPAARAAFDGGDVPIHYPGSDWAAHRSILSDAGFVVAFRLHAAIFACGSGVPFACVLLDQRHHGFAATLGLTEWSVPLDGALLGDALVDRMRRTFEGVDGMDYRAIESRKRELRQAMDGFMDRCLGIADAVRHPLAASP